MKRLLIFVTLLLALPLLAQTPLVGNTYSTLVPGTYTTLTNAAGGGGSVNRWYTNGVTSAGGRSASSSTAWTAAVAVSQSGTVDKLEIYVNVYSGSVNVVMGLYGVNGTTLLGTCTAVATSGTGWVVGTLTTPQAISSGTYYVGYLSSASTANTQYAVDSSSSSGADNGLTYPTLPNPFVDVFSTQPNTDAGIHLQ